MIDLWTCPDCGRQFANLNQAHSCLTLTLGDVLEDASPMANELYRAVEAALGDCGEFRIHPQQTRIAFITAMTFASVRLAMHWVDLSLITAEPIEDGRISGIDLYGPTSFASEVRIRSAEEVDADVLDWLCLAYQRGLQETLDPSASVEPVAGATLEKLRVPLASRVVEVAPSASLRSAPPPRGEETDLALSVPRFAVEAFAGHPQVIVRAEGTEFQGEVSDEGTLIADVASLGLGVGDPVDLTLRADL